MRLMLCAFVAGCWLVQQLPALPPALSSAGAAMRALACATALVLACMVARMPWRRGCAVTVPPPRFPAPRWLVTCLAGVLAGSGWAAYRASERLADRLPPALESVEVQVTGTVVGLPSLQTPGLRFAFAPDVADGVLDAVHAAGPRPPPALPSRLLLNWQAPPEGLLAGDRLALSVRLRRPHGLANRHGFDQEYWLLQHGIGATGYVRTGTRLAGTAGWRRATVDRLRGRLRERLGAAMPPGAPYAGVLVALAIGDQSGIAPAQWALFTRTGIGHLISISGLHITMVSGLIGAMVRRGWRHSLGLARLLRRPLPLRCPAQRAAAFAAMLAALCHGLISGMEVPAQRTVIMVAAAALSIWLHRSPPASLVLAWAAAAALAIDPWAVRSASFWLSFGAVAAIFLVAADGQGRGEVRSHGSGMAVQHADAIGDGTLLEPKARWWERVAERMHDTWREGARVQWAVTVGLVAPTLVLFQQLSLVSPLANAVAIPLVSLLVTPAVLVATALLAAASWVPGMIAQNWLTPAGKSLLWASDRALQALEVVLRMLAGPDWAVWQSASPGAMALAMAVPGTLILLAPPGFGWRLRFHGLLLLGPLLAAGRSPPLQGVRATVFDVGQGAAVLIETRRHVLLYDAGPAYGAANLPRLGLPGQSASARAPAGSPPRYAEPDAEGAAPPSAADRVVLPFLRATGIRRLDALVISHEDADHAGGARAVLDAMPVAQFWSGAPLHHPLLRAPPGKAGSVRGPCEAGLEWEWDGVRFAFLHPLPGQAGHPALASNARSCVLRVATAAGAILLTGDIDAASERSMMQRLTPGQLRADLLLVPHHGSITSSTAAWLDAVQPAGALFQLGYRNRYRHPHPRVWARYGERDIARWRTDHTGMLSARVAGSEQAGAAGILVRAFRQTERRYWRDAPPSPQ
ncbi:DNA internalization-related competence protein ComEC/Rec2 [Paracidovorax citrulli]